LEVESLAVGGTRSPVAAIQGVEVEIGDRGRGEEWRLDFEHSALGEEGTDFSEDVGAEMEGFGTCGWAPGIVSNIH
jgi:hypothetical protein